ncbi:MAG TPA: antitoxin VbhA family protein [Noviherbaspirillum sp.]
MANPSVHDRQRRVKNVLASWSLEGFQPDVDYLALLDRYVSGELTTAQISVITDAAFRIKGSELGGHLLPKKPCS